MAAWYPRLKADNSPSAPGQTDTGELRDRFGGRGRGALWKQYHCTTLPSCVGFVCPFELSRHFFVIYSLRWSRCGIIESVVKGKTVFVNCRLEDAWPLLCSLSQARVTKWNCQRLLSVSFFLFHFWSFLFLTQYSYIPFMWPEHQSLSTAVHLLV